MKTGNNKPVPKVSKPTAKKAVAKPTGTFCYKDKNGTEISGSTNDADAKEIAYREQKYKYSYKFLILIAIVVLSIIFKEQILLLIPTFMAGKAGSMLTTLINKWKMPP